MDFTRLLESVESDPPSGAELRNDPRFHAIERLLEPAERSRKLNEDGSVNTSAPDVEWQQVVDDSFALAADGRDLRLLVIVVRAANRLEGFPGLAEGLRMLKDTVAGFWDSLHPELRDRPDPRMAALPRTNALKQLENDDNGLLGDLKFTILINARGVGPIVGRDLADASLSDFDVLNNAASGLSQAEKDAIVARHAQTVNRVNGVCRAMVAEEPERATAMLEGIKACETALAELIAAYTEAGGFGTDPSLSLPELEEFLGQCRKTMEAAQGETGTNEAPAAGTVPVPGAAAAGAPLAHGGGAPGSIGSRADVEQALEAIIGFYERTEPASPMPHLIRRIKRMVPMDFMELIEEIAPSGVREFKALAGVDDQPAPRRRGRSQVNDADD